MNNRLLYIAFFALFVVGVIIMFKGCSKDKEFFDDELLYRSQYHGLTEDIQEHYNWFNVRKNTLYSGSNDTIITPFFFDVDWHSGAYFNNFGYDTRIYNVKNDFEDFSLYVRVQIAISKNTSHSYSARMLLYVADSIYYAGQQLTPNISNFTGVVFEVADFADGFENAYFIYAGQVVKKIRQSDVSGSGGNGIDFRSEPQLGCGMYKCNWGICKAWRFICGCVRSILSQIGDYFGGIFEDAFGNWVINWELIGGSASGWWSWGNSFDYDPVWVGGGGSGWAVRPRPRYGDPWNKEDAQANHECYIDQLKYIQENAPELLDYLNDPCWGGNISKANLEYLLKLICAFNNNVSIFSDDAAMIITDSEALEWIREKIISSQYEILNNAIRCGECALAFEALENDGIFLTDDMKIEILKDVKDCTNQEEVECAANKLLFFARSDIQEIIFNNSLIDPCNPDLTSQDIFNEYVNNCYNNFWGKELEDIVGDIAESRQVILETKAFKNCKNVYCIWNKLKELDGSWTCKTIKKIEGYESKALRMEVAKNIGVHGMVRLESKNLVRLIMNEHWCNSNEYLEIAETLIHELVHAHFKLDPKISSTDPKMFRDEWQKYVNKKYGVNYSEHHVMVLEYMIIIANDLRKLDGNRYPYDHYIYLVWLGLERSWPGFYSQPILDDFKEKYEKVKNNRNKIFDSDCG